MKEEKFEVFEVFVVFIATIEFTYVCTSVCVCVCLSYFHNYVSSSFNFIRILL